MKLQFFSQDFAICKLKPEASIPSWATKGEFYSLSRSGDELSIVCEEPLVPKDVQAERSWKAFRVVGKLDFSLTGILSSIAEPLAAAKISLFAISTFDTDYILIKKQDQSRATECLKQGGFTFI